MIGPECPLQERQYILDESVRRGFLTGKQDSVVSCVVVLWTVYFRYKKMIIFGKLQKSGW